MAGFFSMEGPFVKYGTLLFDIIILSAVWAISSGIVPSMFLLSTGVLGAIPPIISILLLAVLLLHWAPATCAVEYTMGKKQRGTDTYTMRDFLHGYKTNYKQMMILGIVITLILCVIIYNLWLIYENVASFGMMTYVILPLEILVGIEVIFISLYLPGLMARFEMGTKDFLKYSFLMANKHLLTTIIVTVLFGASVYACLFVNMGLMFIVPGVYMYLAVAILERVFKNYMPSEDEEIEEEVLEGFDLDQERQAIINRYLNQTKFDDEGEYSYVKIDKDGKEVVETDDYQTVRVEHTEEEETESDGKQ